MSSFQILHPRTERIRGIIQVRLSFQIDGFSTGFAEIGKYSTSERNGTKTRDLESFADRYSIPWNPPTNFHPDLIATILQTHLLSLCVLLFQQSHLFPICVVSTYNDSRKDLHRLCQNPRIVSVDDFTLPIRLHELLQAPFVLPEKFLFCTDTLGSIGWSSPDNGCLRSIMVSFLFVFFGILWLAW